MVIRQALPRIAGWKYASAAYALLLVAGLTDLLLTLHLPINASLSGTSRTLVRLAAIGTVVVQVGIWLLAMRGAANLMRYVHNIGNTLDGRGMADIAKAMLWLIVYIVLVPLTSSIAEQSLHQPHSYGLVVLHNHLPLLAMIVAVGYLYRGSMRLLSLTKEQPTYPFWGNVALALFAVVAVLFTWHFFSTVPDLMRQDKLPRFVGPPLSLLFTYILPHILTWLFGTFAILNLWQYSTRIDGTIYRQLFRNLYQGILLVFVGTFVAQLLIASNVTLSDFSIGVVIIYAVLIVAIIGYVLIYRGIQHLIKIEDVS